MSPQKLRKVLEQLSDGELWQLSPLGKDRYPSPMACRPHPRQGEFLALDCEEALYGGAAGGGKTQALLMWLAEGIHIPRYAAVIFRRTYPQLSKADGLIPKSRQMYTPLGGVFKELTKTWTFPSGATIELGHLQYDTNVHDYQGAAFTRIAFDELTQFSESQYRYLFSRLGRTDVGIKPGMRAASNPDGLGRLWVKNRFVTDQAIAAIHGFSSSQPTPPGTVFWKTDAEGTRAFLPSRVADNPSLEVAEYSRRLATYLDPITRERLLNGDWSIAESGRIKPGWLRHFTRQGTNYLLWASQTDAKPLAAVSAPTCTRLAIVDSAATSEEVVAIQKGKQPSHSVIMVFDVSPGSQFFVIHVERGFWDFPELLQRVSVMWRSWQPSWVGIEDEKTGRALWQMLARQGSINVRPLKMEGKDKLARAAEFLNRAEQNQVYLDYAASWKNDLLSELLVWTGHPDEPSDQIDCLAYAVREWQKQHYQPASIRIMPLNSALW